MQDKFQIVISFFLIWTILDILDTVASAQLIFNRRAKSDQNCPSGFVSSHSLAA
jgi:hypothetical protein